MSLQHGYKSFWRVLVVLARWALRRWLHRRCLERIDELERDLFPEWFPSPPSFVQSHPSPYGAEVSFAPGVRWPVAAANCVQMVMPHGSAALQRELLLGILEKTYHDGYAETRVIPSDGVW